MSVINSIIYYIYAYIPCILVNYMEDKTHTTIRVKIGTRDMLSNLGSYNDTHDDIILRLIAQELTEDDK